MSRFRTIVAALILVAMAGVSSEAVAQGGCMTAQDGQARQLVAQGQVVSVYTAVSRAGISRDDVATVVLCRSGAGYVYRVQLRDGGTRNIPAG